MVETLSILYTEKVQMDAVRAGTCETEDHGKDFLWEFYGESFDLHGLYQDQ